MTLEAIFFDVGNTLLFADPERVLEPLHRRGIRPSAQQLQQAERVTKQKIDAALAGGGKVDRQFWTIYFAELLGTLKVADPEVTAELIPRARMAANWDVVAPGAAEVLSTLKKRYRLAVISNSDGHMAELLEACGLAQHFEAIIDSTTVGVEKPDPRIFRLALEALRVAPEQSLYVGDVYSIDYLGAQAVGMRCILMDCCGAYQAQDVPRVRSLAELAEVLK